MVIIVVAIGVVFVAVAVVVLALGGGVAFIIVGINCLFFCFIVFNLVTVNGQETSFT